MPVVHARPVAGQLQRRSGEKVKNRKSKVQSWFMDLNLVMGYWGGATKRAYHHTAPINALYGLHEALVMLQEEGLENAWARHQHNHLALRAGLEAMGLKFRGAGRRTPAATECDDPGAGRRGRSRGALHCCCPTINLEIGAGLGAMAGKVWRIGLMGYSCKPENVMLCLSALGSVLSDMGLPIHVGDAEAAAHGAYAALHAKAAQQKQQQKKRVA